MSHDARRPKLTNVPSGWHFVRQGKVERGDRMWQFNGDWIDCVDRASYLGSNIEHLPDYVYIIRKDDL